MWLLFFKVPLLESYQLFVFTKFKTTHFGTNRPEQPKPVFLAVAILLLGIFY